MPDEESQGGAQEGEDAPVEAERPEAGAEQPTEADQPAEAPAQQAAGEEDDTRPRPPAGGIADLLAEALPDVKFQAYQGMTDVIVEVERDDIPKVMPMAKDDPRLDLKFLRSIFGVDLEDQGFEVVYQLMSHERGHEVVIKTRVPRDDAHVASVTSVWKGANWHERETRDMFGITFDDHPHLLPLLLPEDMTDHFPLRKDNPLAEIEEWQTERLPSGADEGGDDGGEE